MRRTSIGKFKVLVTIDCTMSHEQEVEATSMDEACRKALDEERVRQSLPVFNIDDGSIHPENAYIADPQNCVFHDAVCEGCGRDTPCEEACCKEPPGHLYVCPECRERERRKPADPMLALAETRFDGE